MWRSEDNFWMLVLSFHHVASGIKFVYSSLTASAFTCWATLPNCSWHVYNAQVLILSRQTFYPLSYPPGPLLLYQSRFWQGSMLKSDTWGVGKRHIFKVRAGMKSHRTMNETSPRLATTGPVIKHSLGQEDRGLLLEPRRSSYDLRNVKCIRHCDL